MWKKMMKCMDSLRTLVIYQNEVFGFAENHIYEFYEHPNNRRGSVPVSIIKIILQDGGKICSCTTLLLTTSTTMGICDVRTPCAIFVPFPLLEIHLHSSRSNNKLRKQNGHCPQGSIAKVLQLLKVFRFMSFAMDMDFFLRRHSWVYL